MNSPKTSRAVAKITGPAAAPPIAKTRSIDEIAPFGGARGGQRRAGSVLSALAQCAGSVRCC